jgi:uncharacterized protein (DUF1697 family)
MTTFVAFLRAINVGGRTVKMQELRVLFSSLGLADVETFIASGNVIFRSPARNEAGLAAKIERHLAGALGYEVDTFLRTTAEVQEIAEFDAYPAAAGPGGTYVALLSAAPERQAVRKLMSMKGDADDFNVRGRDLYWRILGGFNDSTFSGGLLEKTLGVRATVRNITTLRRLAAKYPT